MSDPIYTDPTRRHDFVLLFDVTDGNPNGDPDAGNQPRLDPETMQGLVTDGALKRQIRDWIDLACGTEAGTKIYVQSETALITQHERAYSALGLQSTGTKQARAEIDQVRAWMCQNFYDVRCFGAVMSVGVNAGQVQGPLQLTFARSIDAITPMEVVITRVAVTREEDRVVTLDAQGRGQGGKETEMGRKWVVPYGLYRAHGFFTPQRAVQTGVTAADLALFWQALTQLWELDRSAARGLMSCRGVYIFTHEHRLGNAPAHRLFERIQVRRREDRAVARQFADYKIDVQQADLPTGVVLTTLE